LENSFRKIEYENDKQERGKIAFKKAKDKEINDKLLKSDNLKKIEEQLKTFQQKIKL
jgi:hypothetical protein